MTAFEDITVLLSFRGGWSSDVTVDFLTSVVGEYFTVFKVGCGASEYKIDVAPDKAVLVILAPVDARSILLRTYKATRL